MAEKNAHPLTWHCGEQPFSEKFGDHFYSTGDGRAECAHVYLGGNGLPARWRGTESFTIGELGFGTGLNFLETWRQWRKNRHPVQQLRFVSFEAFPMSADDAARALSSWPELEPLSGALIANWAAALKGPSPMDEQTVLHVVCADALAGVGAWQGAADAWYLDGFSPAKNPDMWSAPLMRAVYDHTAPGGTFASYTAAGFVRKNLQQAGFHVERTPGFGKKRHMICGHKD
ncbi:MAG: tRNA (5-methylaminomethyl-2-thiouridine)(34)-methyltransferase MnmD [Hyphomicrobiales bacterium]